MWVAARAAHSMATDAEPFTRASVAALARHRVDAGLNSVLASSASRKEPVPRVWVARARRSTYAEPGMAVETRALAVARRAHAGIGARFLGVPRAKARSVEVRRVGIAEGELPWKGRDRRAVARRAVALAVTARAQIARARRAGAVVADPVHVVHDVALGANVLVLQVDVASATISHGPLLLVLVAAEARRHRRPKRDGARFRDLKVTANAVAADDFHMRSVFEAEVTARGRRAVACRRFAVAAAAVPRVMRLRMAPYAIGSLW